MKHFLLYIFIFFNTCCFAQQITNSFVNDDLYGVSTSFSNTDPKISIFPNPTSDFIVIDDESGEVATATLYNLLGKEVISFKVSSSTKFDLMDFQKGIYLVQLKDAQDKIIQTVRIRKI